MAKYVPMDLLQSLHGKVCGHSDMYFAEKYGTRYTGKLCNPRTAPYSAEELARQGQFRDAIAAAATALADETERAKYEAEWKKQKQYKTLRGYVVAQLYNAGA